MFLPDRMPSAYSRRIPEHRAGLCEMFFQDFTWFRKETYDGEIEGHHGES